MQPEDIDQLFRERLAGHAPTPPAFVWAEIEAEIQPAKKRRPVMWLAAAAVALLTLLGGAWWLLTGSGLGSAGRPELAATAPARPDTTDPQAAPATTAEPGESTSQNDSEKKMLAQATPAPAPSSSPSEATVAAPAHQPAPVVATTITASAARPGGVQPDPATDRRPSAPAATVASVAPANVPAPVNSLAASATSLPTTTGATAALTRPATLPTHMAAFTGPIEVEVRPATEAPAPVEADRRPGLVSLLRQAGKVVKGERVSLAEAGLPETVTVQARLAGHTLTKVIQL